MDGEERAEVEASGAPRVPQTRALTGSTLLQSDRFLAVALVVGVVVAEVLWLAGLAYGVFRVFG